MLGRSQVGETRGLNAPPPMPSIPPRSRWVEEEEEEEGGASVLLVDPGGN